jgi:osmotically inducible protein OsmC
VRFLQNQAQAKEIHMPTRNASATWNGDLKSGNGSFKGSSGALQGNYSFGTRFESAPGTNPEELIGAAHAACFSMALAAGLGKAGLSPQKVSTTAAVTIDKVGEGFKITKIKLTCEANVPGADAKKFQEIANATKTGCPVSGALSAVPIELEAKLA